MGKLLEIYLDSLVERKLFQNNYGNQSKPENVAKTLRPMSCYRENALCTVYSSV